MQSETEDPADSTERLIAQSESEQKEEEERLYFKPKACKFTADQISIFTQQHKRIIKNQPYIYDFSQNSQKVYSLIPILKLLQKYFFV